MTLSALVTLFAMHLSAAAPIAAPVVEGATWTYTLHRYPPSKARFLLFFGEPPGRGRLLETWTWRIGPRSTSSSHPGAHDATLTRTASGTTPNVTSMQVWNDAGTMMFDRGQGAHPVFSGEAPEDATASDRVRCGVPFLGGAPHATSGAAMGARNGVCAARGGGPADVTPGLQRAALSGPGANAQLGKLAFGLLTGGTIILGDDTARIVLKLKSFRCDACARPAKNKWPLFRAWRRGKPHSPKAMRRHLKRALKRHPADAESLAAIVADVRSDDHVAAVAEVAIAALPANARLPVARVALQRSPILSKLRTLARLGPLHETPNASTLLNLVGPGDKKTATRLLEQPAPVLRAVLAAPTWERDQLKALRRAIKTHPLSEQEAVWVFAAFRFGRDKAIVIIHDAVAADAHGRVFAAQIPEETFENNRVDLLRAHPDWVAQMTPAEKASVLDEFKFKNRREEARALLDATP